MTTEPISDERLLPCPFCGGKARLVREGTMRQSCIVECEDCACRLESNETFESGYAWNRRAGAQRAEPQPAPQSAAAMAKLRELQAAVLWFDEACESLRAARGYEPFQKASTEKAEAQARLNVTARELVNLPAAPTAATGIGTFEEQVARAEGFASRYTDNRPLLGGLERQWAWNAAREAHLEGMRHGYLLATAAPTQEQATPSGERELLWREYATLLCNRYDWKRAEELCALLGVEPLTHEDTAARTVEPQAGEANMPLDAEPVYSREEAASRRPEEPMARVEATGVEAVDAAVEAQLMRIEYQRAEAERLRGTVTYMSVPPETLLELCELATEAAQAQACAATKGDRWEHDGGDQPRGRLGEWKPSDPVWPPAQPLRIPMPVTEATSWSVKVSQPEANDTDGGK